MIVEKPLGEKNSDLGFLCYEFVKTEDVAIKNFAFV